MKLTPEHLNTIKALCLKGARAIRARGDECAATLLLFNSTPAGALGGMTAIGIDGATKDQQAAAMQHYARAPDIACAVLIQEGWQRVLAPGEAIPQNGLVSDHPNREEMLMINVLSKDAQWLLTARIDGKHIDDAELVKVENGNFEGRYIRQEARA